MNKPLLIFGGLGIAMVCGIALWVYLFFFRESAPTPITGTSPFVTAENTGTFTTISENAQTPAIPARSTGSGEATLRKITSRVTLGATYLGDGSVRFVEAGTGHVYQVVDGSETKLSGQTFAQASQATFSPDGTRAAITYHTEDGNTRTFVGALTGEGGNFSIEGNDLPQGASHVAFGNGTPSPLFYTVSSTRGTRGIRQGSASARNKSGVETLFDIPLKAVRVAWEPSVLITTNIAGRNLGYAYRSDMSRVTAPRESLSAIQGSGGGVLFSSVSNVGVISWLQKGSTITNLAKGVVAEKCGISGAKILCALPREFDVRTYPDAWYQGATGYTDEIVVIDAKTGDTVFTIGGDRSGNFDVRTITGYGNNFLLTTTSGALYTVVLTET
jgi:hypothetical protein